LLKEYSPEIIRYFIISSHYRKPVDFSNKGLDDAKNSYERLKNITSKLEDENKTNEKYLEEFKKSMNDDLNTPKALQVLWKLVRDENAKGKSGTIKKIDEVFGLNLINKEKTEEEKKIIEERKIARKNKDYGISDKLRGELEKRGYIVQDDKNGFWVSGTRINLD
jgi:cysteinyl-tRNA synthetase